MVGIREENPTPTRGVRYIRDRGKEDEKETHGGGNKCPSENRVSETDLTRRVGGLGERSRLDVSVKLQEETSGWVGWSSCYE